MMFRVAAIGGLGLLVSGFAGGTAPDTSGGFAQFGISAATIGILVWLLREERAERQAQSARHAEAFRKLDESRAHLESEIRAILVASVKECNAALSEHSKALVNLADVLGTLHLRRSEQERRIDIERR